MSGTFRCGGTVFGCLRLKDWYVMSMQSIIFRYWMLWYCRRVLFNFSMELSHQSWSFDIQLLCGELRHGEQRRLF